MKPIIILYHANCPDGFGAAWAAWKKFGKKAEYIAINPDELPEGLKNKVIYFLDNFPQNTAVIRKLVRENKRVIAIDHHKSNSDYVLYASERLFNMDHSGSVLSWLYFHPGKKVPKFLRYVENVDLWRFSLPKVEELTTYAYSKPFDFKIWSKLAIDFENPRKLRHFFELGKIIGDYEKSIVEGIVRKAELVRLKKYKVLAVNSSIKKFASFVGNRLTEEKGPFGIVWYLDKGNIRVSLRGNGKVDVSKIASSFPSGGGHKNAAGFSIPFKGKFPWKIIKAKNEK